MFQTLQSRLPIELRLAGISSIEQANEFLNSYIKKFNDQFALQVDHIKSVFEKQPDIEKYKKRKERPLSFFYLYIIYKVKSYSYIIIK
jgi:hypothetical protein